MSAAAPRRHRCCPICDGSVRQVNRRDEDDARSFAPGMRRFRCRDANCDWEGMLARLHRLQTPSRHSARDAVSAAEQPARRRAARLSTAMLLLLTAVIAGAIVWVRDLPLPFIGGAQTTVGVAAPSAKITAPLR